MNSKKSMPRGTISRLFVCLRELTELTKINIRTISSAELGERVGLSDVQVRKDLSYFGQFGVSGSGYDTGELKTTLEKILGRDKAWNVAVVGVGHLGSALLAYPEFKEHSLNIVAAFDADVRKIGKQVKGITIQSAPTSTSEVEVKRIGKQVKGITIQSPDEIPKTIKEKKVSIGIITVPAREAPEVAERLIKSGVKCILNFAPTTLMVAENIKVKDVDLSRELETLSYFLVNSAGQK